MDWLVDNANGLYILFVLIAAGFVVAWRFNQRVQFLAFAGIPLLFVLVLFLLTRIYVSDSKQLERNVHEMADAVQEGKIDDLFKHISKDFTYQGMTREILYEAARKSVQKNRIKHVSISGFTAEVMRPQKQAKTSFRVIATGAENMHPPFRTEADFVLEGEHWKLKTVRFYFANQDQEIGVPGL